ncbi:amino acid ABC transporter permease [Microvirga antarctica]|uniref:amino acid ABC transporter permease n=1 Tax=Microvirga antarctica TaxID=2819233 RepID=UPI001B31864B
MKGFNVESFLNYLYSPYLIGGAWTTIWLTAVSIAGGFALGVVIALMRMSRSRAASNAAVFYIWLFRGTPLLIQLIIIYTGLPQLGLRFNVIQSALIGLILNEAAYLAEIVRGGFLSIPKGQIEAARSLGLTKLQTLFKVTGPQVIRTILPPLGNSVNGLLKATSIASVISMEELLRRAQVLIQVRFEVLEIFSVCAIYYLVITSLWQLVQTRIERRFGRAYALPPER